MSNIDWIVSILCFYIFANLIFWGFGLLVKQNKQFDTMIL